MNLKSIITTIFVLSLSFNSLANNQEVDFLNAVKEGSLSRVNKYLKDLDKFDYSDEKIFDRALQLAVNNGYFKVTQALLGSIKYDFITRGKSLQEAARRGVSIKIIDLFLDHGTLIDFQHKRTYSTGNPFFSEDTPNRRSQFQFMMKSNSIKTPLMEAATEGHDKIVKRLLEKGADPILTCNGKTAYDFAVGKNRKTTMEIEGLKPYSYWQTTTDYIYSLPWTPILITTGIIASALVLKWYLTQEAEDCTICREPLNWNVLKLDVCDHKFHKDCMKGLFTNSWPKFIQEHLENPELQEAFKNLDGKSHIGTQSQAEHFKKLGVEISKIESKIVVKALPELFNNKIECARTLYNHYSEHFLCPLCRRKITEEKTSL